MNYLLAKVIRKLVMQLPTQIRLETVISIIKQSSRELSLNELSSLFNKIDLLHLNLEDLERVLKTPKTEVKNWENETEIFKLIYSIMDVNAPWLSTKPNKYNVPGMISEEEICYYHYIAKAYSGWGEIIELGPWLGHSTLHLADAFSNNPKFENRKIHVYDDFIWRSAWMDPHYLENDRPENHGDFKFIFERFAANVLDKLIIHHGKLTDYDGNEKLQMVQWIDKPIEIIVVDCGRTLDANNGWYNIFSKNFVPNRTLIVMQDWRQHRERPRLWYNQTLFFTQQHPNFELVHEVREGGIATILYR